MRHTSIVGLLISVLRTHHLSGIVSYHTQSALSYEEMPDQSNPEVPQAFLLLQQNSQDCWALASVDSVIHGMVPWSWCALGTGLVGGVKLLGTCP